MSLPLFLVSALPSGNVLTLGGSEGHHAAAVARLRVGERLLVGDGAGGTARAVVQAVGKGTLGLRIEERWHQAPPAVRIVVAQGIAKGDRGELAVQAMTEVGVDEILPWAASRSVAVWRGDRGARSRDKWAATARESAKQSRRAWVPTVASGAMSTAAIAARPGRLLVLHEAATMPLTSVDLPVSGDIVLVVGPEGGISDEELGAFAAAGGTPVRLGSPVLRTSTAGVAAIGVLSARLGRW